MVTHQEVFEAANIQENVTECLNNLWKDTIFEDYPALTAKNKGCTVGEPYVSAYMALEHGSTVQPPFHSDHDRIIDGYKTEIKFSLAGKERLRGQPCLMLDKFAFNHIAMGKDWDRLIFMGINPTDEQCLLKEHRQNIGQTRHERRCYFMEKKDFVKHLTSKDSAPFKRQQGGEEGDNDDYIVSSSLSFYKLISLPFVKHISEW
jgi:hypothetical protein